jgi:hypothetical protein
MTVWTMDQVTQVKGLLVRMDADYGIPREYVRSEIAETLDRMAAEMLALGSEDGEVEHTHPLRPDEIHYRHAGNDDRHWRYAIAGTWRPATSTVELLGTTQVVQHPNIGYTFYVPVLTAATWNDSDSLASIPHQIQTTAFEPFGWNDETRRWVYAPTPDRGAPSTS